MYCKTLLSLVIDATVASDNDLRFRKNILKRILKLLMTIDDKVRNEYYNTILTFDDFKAAKI